MITEKEIIQRICQEPINLPPVKLEVSNVEVCLSGGKRADTLLTVSWKGKKYQFISAIASTATPRMFQRTMAFAKSLAEPPKTYSLIIVPYLPPERLEELEKEQVSGVDLCGNGILIIPDELLICRSGKPNQYRQSALIKNVYQGETSLVARAFLVCPEYGAVNDIWTLIQSRFGKLNLSTVSKALKQLEEDLIIGREGKSIRLLQADKLLDQLNKNYVPPKIKERLSGKCTIAVPMFLDQLFAQAEEKRVNLVLTGASSVDRYATMATEPTISVYCSENLSSLSTMKDIVPSTRFPTIEIQVTDDPRIFFDKRAYEKICYASPVQTWLELMSGDKRQQETAEQVKAGIIESLAPKAATGE